MQKHGSAVCCCGPPGWSLQQSCTSIHQHLWVAAGPSLGNCPWPREAILTGNAREITPLQAQPIANDWWIWGQKSQTHCLKMGQLCGAVLPQSPLEIRLEVDFSWNQSVLGFSLSYTASLSVPTDLSWHPQLITYTRLPLSGPSPSRGSDLRQRARSQKGKRILFEIFQCLVAALSYTSVTFSIINSHLIKNTSHISCNHSWKKWWFQWMCCFSQLNFSLADEGSIVQLFTHSVIYKTVFICYQ